MGIPASTWAVLTGLLGLAVIGVLGRGPLRRRIGGSPDGTITVGYDSVMHFRTPAEVRLKLGPRSIHNHLEPA